MLRPTALTEIPAPWPRSWYAATVDLPRVRPALRGDRSVQVCIVGGGLTGLGAALTLAERGVSVLLLEAQRVGWGASGRNGGQLAGGYNQAPSSVRRMVGPEAAQRLIHISDDARAWVWGRVARHGIACDLQEGYLSAAIKPRQVRWLREELETAPPHWAAHMRLLEGEALRDAVASPRYRAGLQDDLGGAIQPLAYTLGLAQAAAAAGAQIVEQTPAIQVVPGARPQVRTPGGTVTADAVILATNAYGRLDRSVGARIMPTGTYMVATAPLSADQRAAVSRHRWSFADINFVLNYYRLSHDGRLLFGGGVNYTGSERFDRPRSLRRTLEHYFPTLAGVRIDYAWSGFVAITVNRLPDVGTAGEGVVYAQGYSGHGLMLSGLVGEVLADAVTARVGHSNAGMEALGRPRERGRFEALDAIPHLPFPGGRLLRTPLLMAAMAWYRLRDAL